jgi:outer membrane protein insertion porin family
MAVGRLLTVLVLGAALTAVACREDTGDIRIKSFRINGVKSIDQGPLMSALQTRKGSRIPWGKKRYFNRKAFEADLKRIEAYYHDRGFPDTRVTSFDVKLNETQSEVDLTVNVAEGQPVLVADIVLEHFAVLAERDQRSLSDSLPLKKDQPFDRQLAMTSRERALNMLRDHGYPYAEVALEQKRVGPRRETMILRATPGVLAHFGEVRVAGAASVGDYVIQRQLTYKPGDLFKRTEMRESQRKLYALELFEFVNIEPQVENNQQPTEVPTRVVVAEGKHRKVTFDMGYGSEEKARARIRWDHVNFFGGARQAGFEGKWSSLDRGVRMDYTEPYFFSSHLSLNFEGRAWHASEPAYNQDTIGGTFKLRHRANSQNEWSASLINEYTKDEITEEGMSDPTIRDDLISLGLDPRTGQTRGTVSAVAFDISRSTAPNLLDARKGYLLSAHVEQAGKWLWGTYNYYAVLGEARHYLTLFGTTVLANRLRLGTTDPFADNDANVPFHKRYFLGGASSIRGWGRFEVSPLDGGLPIGGLTMVEGSSEIRFPVVGKLAGVVFLDYGNAWETAWNFDFADLRYALGSGLRYLTPVGPARFDFGYQLNPIEGLLVNGEPQKRRWRVHFSIGQAF